ncbi:MAG: 2-hydroxyacid dehydrogenase [Burkholderiales bacterium]
MHIVFHGENAASFSHDFQRLVGQEAQISVLPDALTDAEHARTYVSADVIVGARFSGALPKPQKLQLFHVPGAGYDAVDLDAIPDSAVVCNCFGHEQAIAEYVMAALLERHVPLADADRHLRLGEWTYTAGSPDRLHGELAEKTIGLLGFGHIGKAIAVRAKAFEMKVHVANRSAVPASSLVDRSFDLNHLHEFWGSADFFVVSVPSSSETAGIVNAGSFAAMRPSAVVMNVGRGPTIDERSLYEALESRRIAGAVIDTWYRYPSPNQPTPPPSKFPFHELRNVVMTPHMSGWTHGTIARRRQTIAENIGHRAAGRPCINVVRPARI